MRSIGALIPSYEVASRLRCPVLAIPARPAQTAAEAEQQYLARKEYGLARLNERIPGMQIQWMDNSIHDIPLLHPAELANLIVEFARQVS